MTEIQVPAKIAEIFSAPKMRYRAARGGRGSGKTRGFALMAAVMAAQRAGRGERGLIVCAREFQNSLRDSSFSETVNVLRAVPELGARFDIGREFIRTRDGRMEFVFAGLRHNIDALKSKSNIHLLWADEAQTVPESSWRLALPTVRAYNSEIWATWNPRYEHDAVERRFRLKPPLESYIGREINWRDNPFFPAVLDLERRNDLRLRPDFYPHIWEGKYITAQEGAYWTAELSAAEREGRIDECVRDPLLPVKCFFDLGGASGRADATAIWSAQFAGERILLLDYYEAVGQPLSAHADYLRKWGNPELHLPHDGRNISGAATMSWQTALYDAGFHTVEVHRNLGAGAALKRVEAARRIMSRCLFNAEACKAGLDALRAYHEKRDAIRNIGLGPEHDWSSHGADAFGLLAVAWNESRGESFAPGPAADEDMSDWGDWGDWGGRSGDISAY